MKKKILYGIVAVVAVCAVIGILFGGPQSNNNDTSPIRQNFSDSEAPYSSAVAFPQFGFISGEGEATFLSGATYSGEWDNYMLKGTGTLGFPEIGTYTGEFVDSKKNGFGTFLWDNGDSYEGFFANDTMNGNGTYTFSNGRTLTGEFKDGRFISGTDSYDGAEVLFSIQYSNQEITTAEVHWQDGTSYVGGANADGFCGEGLLLFPNGDQYQGSFSKGARNGQGTYSWENGDTYEGSWIDDQMNGDGKYTFSSGDQLIGVFEHNNFLQGDYSVSDDTGTYSFQFTDSGVSSVSFTLTDGTTYSGDYTDGHATGSATITYPSGDTYTGDVVDAIKQGSGTYKWTTGASYVGSWKNDQMDGEGTYYYSESPKKLVGTFQKNVPIGECQYYTTTTLFYGTTWKNGVCVKVTEYAK